MPTYLYKSAHITDASGNTTSVGVIGKSLEEIESKIASYIDVKYPELSESIANAVSIYDITPNVYYGVYHTQHRTI